LSGGFQLIDGVRVKQLRLIPDERGFLMELLRSDGELFEEFGQVYVTVAYPGAVKAWHYHEKQTDFFSCIKGMAKVVLYDRRRDSKTKGEVNEFFIGELNPILLRIPAGIAHGFKATGAKEAYIINCPNKLYNYDKPDEFRIPFDSKEIPYKWDLKNR